MITKTTLQKMGNRALREYVNTLEREARILRLDGMYDIAALADQDLAAAGLEVIKRIMAGELTLLKD